MSKSVIIVIGGLPATGKTTLGKQIAETCGVPFFSKDTFKEVLFDTLGWTDREWSQKIGIASYRLLDYLIRQEVSVGRSIIVESNFSRPMMTSASRKCKLSMVLRSCRLFVMLTKQFNLNVLPLGPEQSNVIQAMLIKRTWKSGVQSLKILRANPYT